MASTSGSTWKLFYQAVDYKNQCLGYHFSVYIATSADISDPTKDIFNQLPRKHVAELNVTDLELWKLAESLLITTDAAYDSALTNLKFPSAGSGGGGHDVELLNPVNEISECWDEQPPKECVHLVVRVPQVDVGADLLILSISIVDLTTVGAVSDVRGLKRKHDEETEEARARDLLTRFIKQPPSSLAIPSNFQSRAIDLVFLNRPFNCDTIPITLLQKEFGEFMDDRELTPSIEAQDLLQTLTDVACRWHGTENNRRSEVQAVLHTAGLYFAAEEVFETKFRTDGNLRAVIVPPAIRECKNESGCALFEAIGYYANFLDRQLRHRGTCFPCILMLNVAGPCLAFYGCLWTGLGIAVEPLTPWYDLTTHWTDEAGRLSIAAGLSAFMNTVRRIEARYLRVPDLPPRKGSYPYPTSYIEDETGQQINFKYEKRLPEKLIFSARADAEGIGPLIVKFARRYSAEAHKLLARLGHAPRLHAVTTLPGSWIMVVMNFSLYPSLDDLTVLLSDRSRQKVLSKVTDIVRALHKNHLVHGDIRSTNLLIDDQILARDEAFVIHLLDFDWAGRIGEVKYPMGVNTKTMTRPAGVAGGTNITVAHDMAMVEMFFLSETLLSLTTSKFQKLLWPLHEFARKYYYIIHPSNLV
ncbi:hypothetical protein BJV78DRAFT_1133032 [Lactifluus subvellereus]|nr:hypothetical protein BJV78DRAFT_1133032 [Lactifluus subvellereus]